MTRVFSFPPALSRDGSVLVLGSIPGEASLTANEYYAHPRNQFWPIMGALIGAGREVSYEERLARLNAAGISLWDVLHSCVRTGSLDSSIREENANDFETLFRENPRIRHIFFNGGKAEQAFRTFVLSTCGEHDLTLTRLPSTSPAHAAMRFEEKLEAWRVIFSAGLRLKITPD
ncbi:MAG: DNA-deoxyinosine glycosylase [Alphaproteobacteria bacterium]|nr:DNA-deoxyinosine glycosylase [Alphaproteobacteria bacterium]